MTCRARMRAFNLFFKLFKIHSLPYFGMWIGLGLLLVGVLKLQKAFCQSHWKQQNHTHNMDQVCDKALSQAMETIGATVFTTATGFTFVGSVFVMLSFTRMYHATHHTLRNIGDPNGSFRSQFDSGLWQVPEETRQCNGAPPRRPMSMGGGFPWIGSILQLLVE